MNVKTLITGLALLLLLSSGRANADWGDVYYCQMTNHNEISLEGKRTFYKLEKFQFKLDQTKNAMVFGSTGIFSNIIFELDTNRAWPRQESWDARGTNSLTYFDEGKFLFTSMTLIIISVSADCEKF